MISYQKEDNGTSHYPLFFITFFNCYLLDVLIYKLIKGTVFLDFL